MVSSHNFQGKRPKWKSLTFRVFHHPQQDPTQLHRPPAVSFTAPGASGTVSHPRTARQGWVLIQSNTELLAHLVKHRVEP